mgnify:CR=1 FL=1
MQPRRFTKLVFVDETGANTKMVRAYARCRRGERLVGVKLGYLWLDPIAAVVVAVFIGYACWEIFVSTSGILADRFVIPEEEIRECVRGVPEVIGTHHIRTRGSADFVFLDLHIWMDAAMPLDRAHSLSHVVKDRLMARFPQIKDAIIHIEPPPRR